MEVLSNGFKANFWVPIEEEPDVDRFIDEQIMIDMDRFMLVGTLEKVSTCKKKNEEKEYEYFKQITVQVNNICSADDNNINITIPGKKDEFLYDVKFRYAPEPEQVSGDDMEAIEKDENTDIETDESIDKETDEILDIENENEKGYVLTPAGAKVMEADAAAAAEEDAPDAPDEPDDDAKSPLPESNVEAEIDAIFDADGSPADAENVEADDSPADGEPLSEILPDDNDDEDFSFADEPVANAIVEPEDEGAAEPNDDGLDLDEEEEIDWGD